MAERRPDPPDPRASLVDSGWSEAPAPPERELPAYEDTAREALVTRVDDQIQARIAAMNYDDKTEVTSAPRAAPAPAPAPAPVSRPQRRPPPLTAPPGAPPPSAPATVRKPSALPTPVPVAPVPLELASAPTEERTLVDAHPPTATPSSAPPPPPRRPSQMPPPKPRSAPPPRRPSVAPPPPLPPLPAQPREHAIAGAPVKAFSAQPAPAPPPPAAPPLQQPVLAQPVAPVAPLSVPPPRPVSVPPPAVLPSFAPLPPQTSVASFVPAQPLGEALRGRVRAFGGEFPLWGVLAPVFVLTALVAALAAGLIGTAGQERTPAASVPSAEAAATPAAAPPSTPKPGDTATAAGTGSLVERARSGDPSALASLEQKKPADRSVEEALGLATGKMAQATAASAKLRARLAADPGLAKDPKVIADLRKFAQETETSRDALAAMAAIPGPLSADLLYEAWTSTAERSETTELAQALLMSRDVRAKASPALAVALDLRDALELREGETCEANAKILPRAIEVGDKRAFAPLSRLLRHNGCGPTKRDDCYACLREGELLKKALTTVKLRREPELVRRDAPPPH